MLYEGYQVSTGQASEPKTIASPVGGLNGRDSLANMQELDAYELENLFPGTSTCVIREGCAIHQDPLGHPVTSLEVFASGTQQTILAFSGPNVIDATATRVPVTLKADLVRPETVATMFSTVADLAQWLIITTGADVPMSFNGAALTNLVFTGLNETETQLNFVCPYQGRLFWGTEDKLGFYYLPPGQIQGAMEWFDLGQASTLGGRLQAIATFSEDSGDGPGDYIVFISSRGEYFMFKGTDPGDAEAWDIVGRYRGGEPIGRKCVIDYAGDILVITSTGVHQFSEIRKVADTQIQTAALSSKLGDILLQHNKSRDIWGWNMQLYPVGGMLIVNVPDSNNPAGEYHQFVMNTTTMAWTKFNSREWDSVCWCMSNKQVYFGRWDGSVRRVGGQSDNDKAIRFTAKQAYNYMDTPQHKHFNWAMFLVKSDSPVQLSSRLSVDFIEKVPYTPPSPIGAGDGAFWDLDYWDEAVWGTGAYTQRWIAAYGDYGVAASHWLSGEMLNSSFEWYSTEHVFEKTQGLL